MYITKKNPLPGNPVIITFFTKPVLIKSKHEWVDSTHTSIVKRFSSYEASVCVGVFLKLTNGYQSKGSSAVALSNLSGEGGNWHLSCASPNS